MVTNDYMEGVEEFITFAQQHKEGIVDGKIRCPCKKKRCQNKNFLDADTVRTHLYKNGFVKGYHTWRFHGETELVIRHDENIQFNNASLCIDR